MTGQGADQRALPRYASPPVVEAALGVEFDAHPALTPTELFELWQLWRPDFPKLSVQPPAPPPGSMPLLRFGSPAIRLWMLDDDRGHQLVQLQDDRLFLNWRKLDEVADYPSFGILIPIYRRLWDDLIGRLQGQGFPPPTCRTVEMGYVNRLPTRDVTLPDVLTWLATPPPSDKARLKLEVSIDRGAAAGAGVTSVTAAAADQDSYLLNVFTRLGCSEDGSDIWQLLDQAHEASVRVFTDSTRASMHTRWGRVE